MADCFCQAFFEDEPCEVGPALLGCKLSTVRRGVLTSGIIVETEAYGGPIDQASHAYRGPTRRNQAMFEAGGHCYVYFSYGMHYCVNVVTGPEGVGCAVLIRGLEPLEGIETMERRRSTRDRIRLTNGPGKLCQAMAINKKMLGENLLSSEHIRLERFRNISPAEIGVSTRIGISKSRDLKWRFYLKNNRWVSGN